MPPLTRLPEILGRVDVGAAHRAAFFESLLLLLGVPLAVLTSATRFSTRAYPPTD
jgi:hypothetical protein